MDFFNSELMFFNNKDQYMDKRELMLEGIAHDLKNILTGIMANVDLAKIYVQPESEVFDVLNVIGKNIFRAQKLSEHLHFVAKGEDFLKRKFCITKLSEEIAEFVLSDSDNIILDISVPERLWYIEIDETQAGEIIENLLVNAKEAMPEGGTIYIQLENMISDGYTDCIPKGKYVKISVTDTGKGIPKEYLHRIFEPHFSTKERGSGFGLANSYCIIKNFDGYISVESELGQGTTFNVCFPAYEKI